MTAFSPRRHAAGAAPWLAGCALALGASPVAAGDPPPKLTIERINAQPSLAGAVPTRLAWHPDGRRLTWLRRTGDTAALEALDVKTGKTSVLLDGAKLLMPAATAPPASTATGAASSPAEKPGPLPLAGAEWLPDGQTLLVPAAGDIFTVDVRTGAVRVLVRTPEAEEFAEASPDGTKVAFVRGSDLWVVDVASGRQTQLTRSGSETLLNGRLDWVYEEELASRTGQAFVWSPDSRQIAYLQLDQSRVPTFPIVDFLPVRNEVRWQRYPEAGAPNAVPRLGVVGLGPDGTPGPERLVSFTPDDVYVLPQLAFTPDSRHVAFQHMNRAQNELELRLLPVPEAKDAPLGTARTVITERSKTWVNHFGAPRFFDGGRRFLWVSERDGWAHAYACDLEGACRQVTRGPWIVDAAQSFAGRGGEMTLDERTGFLYFTATEKDPRERHLYRTRLDGTGRTRMTKEDGTHRTLVSPDGRFYADTWSDAKTPPRVWVESQDGKKRFSVEDNAGAPILGFERGTVEWAEVKAKDGTTLYGALLKPAAFDPAKKYPVVVSVYGGPEAQVVTNAWGLVSPFEQLLASRGFLVWSLDNRGAAGRGQAFEEAVFHDLGRVELEDQIQGVEYLKALPYVDPARIGITGWSYGGYMTLYAVTHAPTVFASAVAGAPVTDWKLYDSIYTERYMGTPEQNSKGYETSSPLAKASFLQADLLIIHGTGDDNVHFANTIAFAAALNKANRPHELDLHARQMHGFAAKEDRISRDRAVLDHFERTLKAARPE
jgi:dipeptidyl-peptidase-4